MTPWMRKMHKWVGLLVGLQFVLWLVSGLTMGLLDADEIEGSKHRAHENSGRSWPHGALEHEKIIGNSEKSVISLSAGWLLDKPVYEMTDGQAVWVVDAVSGKSVAVGKELAASLAKASYVGEGQPQAPLLLTRTVEARGHEGPIWRIDFSDPEETTVYVSAQNGKVLEHRNRTWRLFDFFWMLHIMDYTGRDNFNNPLVIMVGMAGLWLALTGSWLLVASFRINEFVPQRWRRTRVLAVFDPDGTRLRTIRAPAGDSVYLALARNGLQLPSNCGGGQSCGLCEVRFLGDAPEPSSADRSQLSPVKLKLGFRLACNLPIDQDLEVEVAGGAGLWNECTAKVESIHAVTPFLREIVLKTDSVPGTEYQPGSYLQVHVPGYSLKKQDIAYPQHHHSEWSALDIPPVLTSSKPVRRSYSLALPVEKAGGHLTLLARFSPGRMDNLRQPTGKGSTYLYSLKPGDSVRFSGPFGDFSVKPGGREKIFIGGGAGMAPLRAMIHACLDNGANERIHFWYGARSSREAPYVDEMADLAQLHANFSWHLVLSEEGEGSNAALKGVVHQAAHEFLLRDHPDINACDFYLCGPPAMLSATRHLLQQMGVAEEHIAFDDFKI